MDNNEVATMRASYHNADDAFLESQILCKEPFALFTIWFDEARKNPGIIEANAMCLATASADGVPSARFVLLKGYGPEGFTFFTNFNSRKGKEISENPRVALTFYWEPLKRSVRIEGNAGKISDEEADDYFHSRPIGSQIGACVSHQSSPIPNREHLSSQSSELHEKFKNQKTVTRPDYWGGFLVVPHTIEFWQGQTDRLHDRIRFRKPCQNEKQDGALLHQGENGWLYERLSP